MNKRLLQVKMGILVVLFLTTILLLYLLWTPANAGLRISRLFSFGGGAAEAADYRELLVPRVTVISAGDGSYQLQIRNGREPLAMAYSLIKGYRETGEPQLEEISADQYRRARDGFRSVELDLGFGIPLSFLLDLADTGSIPGDSTRFFSAMCFSNAAKESILFRDETLDSCFRLYFPSDMDCLTLFRSILKPDCSAYLAKDMIGGSSEALLPVDLTCLDDPIGAQTETEADSSLRSRMAESIFGETFDFVRRISDSFGNITYMYGYGEDTFYAGTDGRLEYRTQGGAEGSDMVRDLKTALEYMEGCGGLKRTADATGLRLSGYSEHTENRIRSCRFEFTQSIGSMEAGQDSGLALTVDMTGGRVTGFSRRLLTWSGSPSGSDDLCAEASNVIAYNSHHIYSVLSNNTLSVAGSEAFEYAADAIESMLPGYFCGAESEVLVPCWILRTKDGVRFYFDLFTGQPLGFRR